MFHAYSGIFTKLHISRHICPHCDSDKFRMLALPVQVMLSDTCSSSQVLVLNHISGLFGTFFHFCKSKRLIFCSSRWYFNNNNNNNDSMQPTLAPSPPNPHYTRQYTRATHASTPPRKHATHATHASMPPTQARLSRKITPHATTLAPHPRYPRQHEYHAISQTPFFS